MGAHRRRGYVLTEIGLQKLTNALNQKEVNRRNYASWLKIAMAEVYEYLDDDTIRKILRQQSVEEASIQSVFKALKLQYQRDIDSVQVQKSINIPTLALDIYENLRVPEYTNFIGRKSEINELLQLISDPNIYRISVEGAGGLGKTTLILEAAYRCLQARKNGEKNLNFPVFDAFIFTSARQQRLISKGLVKCGKPERTKRDIFRAIARTIDCFEISQCSEEEQLELIQDKLREIPTLLIIDNLETIEDQEDIYSLIYELPATVKVVITARQHTLFDHHICLESLSAEDTLDFIEYQAKSVGIELISRECEQIYHTTGGMPGAIIYAIGQLNAYRSLDAILTELKQPQQDISRFWFESGLQVLRKQPAYYLLMALAMFPEPAVKEAIAQVGLPDVDRIIITESLAKLQQLLLVKKQQNRYIISLPLTRSYVFGELANNSDFEQQARERWVKWYIGFSQQYGQKDEKEWHNYEDLELEWENLQTVIEWCIDQNRYEEFLQLWQNINCYSYAQGYYRSDRTKFWYTRLDWTDWLIQAATTRKDWSNLAELLFTQAWTLTVIGNKFDQAKTLFSQAWKLRHCQDINWQLKLAIHLVYFRWKQQQIDKAILWLNLSQKILEAANLEEPTAQRQWFYIFYYRGKFDEYKGNYEQAKSYYHQAIILGETIGWQRAMNIVKNWLADIEVKQGNFTEAKQILDECLSVAIANSDQCRAAFCKESLAFLEKEKGNLQASLDLAKSAYEDYLNLGMFMEAEETRSFIERIK